MSAERDSGDDIRVHIGGSLAEGAQFVAGRDNTQSYVRTHTVGAAPVTAADLAELRSAIESVKAEVRATAPPEQQADALGRIGELEEAIVAGEPDVTTLQYVRQWFGKNLPKLAGSITGLIVHPVVGKIVEAAGELAAKQFREAFGDVGEPR
jgi:hypothetical protein